MGKAGAPLYYKELKILYDELGKALLDGDNEMAIICIDKIKDRIANDTSNKTKS